MPVRSCFATLMAIFVLGSSITRSFPLIVSRHRRTASVLLSRQKVHLGPPANIPHVSTHQLFSTLNNVEISPTTHGTKRLNSLTEGVDSKVATVLQKQKLTKPTPIQAHAIPLLYKGYDVMAAAQTGSGKTMMFALPLVQKLLINRKRNKNSPSAIILNPTRELAMQTCEVIRDLIKNTPLQVGLATGGANVGQQKRQLPKCDILVATPGRCLQFVDERILSLRDTTNVVVDEADRMLDLGFEPQLKRIARVLQAKNKQTILCSATFPLDVQHVASEFLRQDYYFVAVGRVGGTHDRIKQNLIWVDGGPQARRKRAIQEVNSFLKKDKKQRIIVFCNTKEEAERLGSSLRGKSVRVVTGDKEQKERNKALQLFREGKIQILVATDVAARGLDVPDVGLVLQVDAPRDADTFVHRVGRTGRAGAKGNAIALLDGRSIGIAADLVEMLHEAEQEVPAWLLGMAHVSKARRLDEESVISAGGGALQSSSSTSVVDENASVQSNDGFTGQDFRRNVEAGTWGAGRDKSYQSFEDDAYASLEDVDLSSVAVPEPSVLSNEGSRTQPSNADGSFVGQVQNGNSHSTIGREPSFRNQNPSQQLLESLKRIVGSDRVGEKPNRKVLTSLKNSDNQRLRFEYIGMFPFDRIHAFLTSEGSRHSETPSKTSGPGLLRLLMVAEKPSIAEAIAKALSGPRGPRKRRGISRALPVYQFTANAYIPGVSNKDDKRGQRCMITVTSVVGHVFSLGFDQDRNENGERSHADPIEYFNMPVVKQEEGSTGKLRVVEHLRALAGECDHLVLWLDCDAEGENIAHEVIGVARKALEQKVAEEKLANPDRESTRRIHRARFSAITGDALRDAFVNLVEPDAALSRSVDARQELDLRVGVAMTRLLNWRCVGSARRNFSPKTKLVSYGPCQTPALSFCVDRSREIEAFNPAKFWRVEVSARSPDNERLQYRPKWQPPTESSVRSAARSSYKDGPVFEDNATFDQRLAKQVVKLLSSTTAELHISHVENIPEKMNPPLGLNTVALLSAGSKAMGMSPKQVMNVAEKLYSAGFISYPRTETTRYDPTGFDVRSVLREHLSHPEWGRTASHLLRTKYKDSGRPPIRGYDAGDHPPITSLKAATREEVGGGAAWRVYDFISRNFLGSLGDELLFTRQVAGLKLKGGETNADIAANLPAFQLEQVSVDSLGYAGACRWVLRDISAASKEDNVVPFKEGMRLSITSARCESRFTRPPKFLQEHELIELMDKNRIGTDASMAAHVNNIVDRQYVVLCDETGIPIRPPRPPRPGKPRPPRQIGRYLVPSSLGISLLDLFGKNGKPEKSAKVYFAENGSPALLARPRIRALMEEEVRLIANGDLNKGECLDKNLAWFEARYREFEASLTRNRLDSFSQSLEPIKSSLSYWRRLNAFEPVQRIQQPKEASGANQVKKSRGKKKSRTGPPKPGRRQRRKPNPVKGQKRRLPD